MSFIEFINTLNEFNRYSSVPGILFFILYLRSERGNIRTVYYLLLLSFVADLSNYFFIRLIFPNSYIIGNTWIILNFLLGSYLFYQLIPARKKLIQGCVLIFLAGCIISFSFFFSFLELNTFSTTFSTLAFIIYSIVAFLEILSEEPIDELRSFPIFWIITAIFLYSSTTLLKYLFQNYLVFDLKISKELFVYISSFNLVFNIAKNLMFLYAFILVRRGFQDYIHPPKKLSPQ